MFFKECYLSREVARRVCWALRHKSFFREGKKGMVEEHLSWDGHVASQHLCLGCAWHMSWHRRAREGGRPGKG